MGSRWAPGRVAGVYVLVGLVWVVGSSLVTAAVVDDTPAGLVRTEVAKGAGFVAASGLLLLVLLRRTFRDVLEGARRYQALAEQLQEGLYVFRLHPSPAFEYVNPALEDLTGFAAAEWYANPDLPLERVHPDDRPQVRRFREDPDSVRWPVELRWRHPDGGVRWHALFESPLDVRDDVTIRVQGLVVDITAHRQREEQLQSALAEEQRATETLRSADELKTTLLRAVSHELRTPLTTIVGVAELLEAHWRRLDDERVESMLTRLSRNAARLAGLLEDLLDLDRLERGMADLHRSEVELLALMTAVLEPIDLRGRDLTLDVEPLAVRIDRVKVERIVDNLVRNAVRHTPPGTAIRVAARLDDDTLELVVEDDGPGVPQELRIEVFEAFRHGLEAGDSASPGTGIGLALVSQFAALHGGTAWVEERPGGGARFTVRLPEAALDGR